MKQKLFFLAVMLFTTVISFSQVLDQSHAPENIGGGTFEISSTANIGQSFTAGITGNLSQINIRISDPEFFTAVAGSFQLKIYAGNGYSGTLLNTTNFTISTLPGSTYEEFVINLSSDVSVESGSIYTMDLRGIDTAKIYTHGAGTNYANGGLYVSNGSNSLYGSYDYWFKTYVTAVTPTEPEEIVPATHLSFDGVNDYIELPSTNNNYVDYDNIGNPIVGNYNTNTSFHFTTNMTVEFWMNSSTTPEQWDALVAQGDDSWRLALNTDGTVNFAGNGGFGDVSSTTSVIDGNWHHVAATYSSTIAEIYIDGVRSDFILVDASSSLASIYSSKYPVSIGENLQATGRNYTGKMDEVRIWNIARTATEISDNKDCELTGTESGLVAYYKFNQGNGAANNSAVTSLTDATGSNNAVLNNFTLSGANSNFLAGSPIVTGNSCGFTLSDFNVEANSKLNLYPNPVQNNLFVEFENPKTATIQIIDTNGRILITKTTTNSLNNINISSLSTGVYWMKLTTDKESITKKIMKN